MSVETRRNPLIRQGWLRAIIFLVLYLAASIGAGFFISSTEAWFAVNFVIAVLIVYLFTTVIDRKSFTSAGFIDNDFIRNSAVGLCLGTFLICAGTLTMYLLKALDWIDITLDISSLLFSAGTLMMVALSEELVFRGYILRNLLKSFNRWIALIFSATLFTLVHATNPDTNILPLANTFLGGLLTGITYMHTRSLWLPVFFHFGWNFVQGPLLGFPVSGINFDSLLIMDTRAQHIINGGNYGFEGSVVCFILLLLAFAAWVVRERVVLRHDNT